MCGRIQITNPVDAVTSLFDDMDVTAYTCGGADWPHSFNISPTAMLPLIVHSGPEFVLKPAHWGFVPSWAKDKKFASNAINARLETAFEKPYYKSAIRLRRALLPVTAYYEWKKMGDVKQPFRFHLPQNRTMYFACIWEDWFDTQTNGKITSFAILTTEANPNFYPIISEVHHRMPMLISPNARRDWLKSGVESFNGQAPDAFIENGALDTHPVSRKLNKSTNQGPKVAEALNLSNIDLETAYARTHSNQGDLFN